MARTLPRKLITSKGECHDPTRKVQYAWSGVELTRRPQSTVAHVAKKLGVNANLLSCWRQELTKPGKALTGKP